MNEIKNHIVSTFCVAMLLAISTISENNYMMIFSVLILTAMMIIRSFLGEITQKDELFLMAFNLGILLITITYELI
jgi:hypothetical protein